MYVHFINKSHDYVWIIDLRRIKTISNTNILNLKKSYVISYCDHQVVSIEAVHFKHIYMVVSRNLKNDFIFMDHVVHCFIEVYVTVFKVMMNATYMQCHKLGKYLQVPRSSYFWALWSFQMFIGPSFEINLTLSCSVDDKTPRELWNPLSKAVAGEFTGSDGNGKYSCLKDRANFHRSWARQIILLLTLHMM